jgi:hypothetical protein
MAIILIGSDQEESLAHKLVMLGGNPTGKYPGDMAPPGGRPRREGDPVDYCPSEGHSIARELYSLRQFLADNAALIEQARACGPNKWNRLVLEAFERGAVLEPATFEYGRAAGNYATDLVARKDGLYRTRSLPEYGQKLERIAIWKPDEVA